MECKPVLVGDGDIKVHWLRSTVYKVLGSLVLFRQQNALHHHPFHFFSANKRFKEHTELNRAEFQEIDHLGEVFRVQGVTVGGNGYIIEICKSPFERRRHPPNVAFFERQLTYRFELDRKSVV